MDWLRNFVWESNRIEGIYRTNQEEIDAHAAFLALRTITVDDIRLFVSVVQPDAIIRDKKNLNVRVGNHIAPRGGNSIPIRLEGLLLQSEDGDPWRVHSEYEMLHPFTDGNGRSGRALWLWMMLKSERADMAKELGFLHSFYYQTLSNYKAT